MNKNESSNESKTWGWFLSCAAASADEASERSTPSNAGGVSVLEITMTCLRSGRDRRSGQAFWRSGGCRRRHSADAETARACMLAGAQFIVSPSLHLETIACCRRYGIQYYPGP